MHVSELNIFDLSKRSKGSNLRVAYLCGYYGIAGILLFSGIMKMIDPIPAMDTLKAAFSLPDEINLIALTLLPVVEISLAVLMILKIKQKLVLGLVTALFLFFVLFAIYGTAIGLSNDCGCFGSALKSQFN